MNHIDFGLSCIRKGSMSRMTHYKLFWRQSNIPANIFTGAKHPDISTNHLILTNLYTTMTKNNIKPEQPCKKNL